MDPLCYDYLKQICRSRVATALFSQWNSREWEVVDSRSDNIPLREQARIVLVELRGLGMRSTAE